MKDLSGMVADILEDPGRIGKKLGNAASKGFSKFFEYETFFGYLTKGVPYR